MTLPMQDQPFGRFFLPGPTEVRPEVLAAMARPVIGHRGPAMSELLAEADPILRKIFATTRPVYVSTSSATGLMEAGVRNGVRRRALALVNGAFSERFRDLVTDCGREVETYEVAWGRAHEPEEVRRRLARGGFDALTIVHSETSTGVLNPLPDIAQAVRQAGERTGEEVLTLVDGVTSVGGTRVEADGWGLDWLLTGSHKAMALPPGLAFGAASERMMQRAASLPARGHYFDLLEFDRHWRSHQTPNTPALNLVYALVEQMRRVAAETVEHRFARHAEMASRCEEWVASVGSGYGLAMFAPAERRSPTVTAISVPEQPGAVRLVQGLAERGFTIGAGYGKLKDTTIRIGHMGDHTVGELDVLLDALEEVLRG